MNIEVQCGADIGMTEEDTNSLVVTFALDTAGGEAMAKTVKTHFGKAQLLLKLIEIASVGTWFCGSCRISEYIEVTADNLLQRPD